MFLFHFSSTEDVWCLFSFSLSLSSHSRFSLFRLRNANNKTKYRQQNRNNTQSHKAPQRMKTMKSVLLSFRCWCLFLCFSFKVCGWGCECVCVSREDKKKRRKNVYFNISVNFDWCSLSLSHFLSLFPKMLFVFFLCFAKIEKGWRSKMEIG